MGLGGALLVAAGLGALSCGGGGTSPGAQFCQDWAAAFCKKLYECTPVDQRGADFLGGASQAQCTQGWSATCANPQPAGQTFDVNCSGGVHVNTAAKTACLDELSTITCDDFSSPNYTSVCTQVCPISSGGAGAGGTTGAAGTTGSGGTTGAAGTTGSGGTGGGTSSACGTVEPCGGNPVGTWALTAECIDAGELALSLQQQFYCPQATVNSVGVTTSGSASFTNAFAYSLVQNITAAISMNIPSSCTGGLTCTEFAAYQAASAPAGTTFTCSGTTTCVCNENITNSSTDMGTYTVAGSSLNLASTTSGQSGVLGFCVQGSTLHLVTVDGSMHTGPGGQATIAKDVVAQKQ